MRLKRRFYKTDETLRLLTKCPVYPEMLIGGYGCMHCKAFAGKDRAGKYVLCWRAKK